MKSDRISTSDAALLLGLSEQGLREHMKRGLIDVGFVIDDPRKKRKQYVVMKSKLERVLGRELSEI